MRTTATPAYSRMQGGGLSSSCVAWVGSRWKEETHPGSHVQVRGWVSENNGHPSLQSHARGWAFIILCGAMHVSISKSLKTKHTFDAKCVFASGGTWVELAGGGRNDNCIITQVADDKGYFKSQYIKLVITFLILNQKLCFWGHKKACK